MTQEKQYHYPNLDPIDLVKFEESLKKLTLSGVTSFDIGPTTLGAIINQLRSNDYFTKITNQVTGNSLYKILNSNNLQMATELLNSIIVTSFNQGFIVARDMERSNKEESKV